MRKLSRLTGLAAALLAAQAAAFAQADELPTYERDVRPILRTHCFQCHGEGGELQGGLDLRLRRLILEGGDSGAAIEPENSKASFLFERLKLGEMPPEDVEHRPTEEEIAVIGRWIDAGAKTAHPEPESITDGYFTEEERSFWAFQPVHRPLLPEMPRGGGVRTPIDRFLQSRLEEEGLTYSPAAEKTSLLRRGFFSLLGRPPSLGEAEAFLSDQSPDAWERLIDRLLASPQYGERWGRHWLDAAGYADSEGVSDEDPERPDAWRYRDWVIAAHNRDLPWDEFIRWQLCGDELIRPPYSELPPVEIEKLIATGFLRTAPDGTAGANQPAAQNENIAGTLEIVSTSLLGLTVGCARCHDHRYDPIPQADYYRLRAIFEPAFDARNWKPPQERRVSLYSDADRQQAAEIEAEAKKIDDDRAKRQQDHIARVFESELEKLPEELREPVREARETPEKKRAPAQKKLLKEYPSVNVDAGSLYLFDKKAADELEGLAGKAKELRGTKPAEGFVRALAEPSADSPPATFVFNRGDHQQPKQEVRPAALGVLQPLDYAAEIPGNDESLPTSGRRLAFAGWLTGGRHPLVARVIVNRVWQHHFGRGLVATPGDFGRLGERPSHPDLLDWLADELVASGWSLKVLHRLIMTSGAYQQSSQRNEDGDAVDSENSLLWHFPVRRLEAEVLRDSLLAVSGELIDKQSGPPIPVMADEVGQYVIGIENLNAGRPQGVVPMHGEDLRRSVYVQVRRSRPLAVLETFDAPAMSPNCTMRASSTVAPQSLLLMNSRLLGEQAEKAAVRVRREAGENRGEQVILAWRLAYSRPPTEEEQERGETFLAAMEQRYKNDPGGPKEEESKRTPEHSALIALCQALLASNEFLYVD